MSGSLVCPTRCDPIDCSLPGSCVHEISQARVLEWVAISFSRGSSRSRDQTQVSCVGRSKGQRDFTECRRSPVAPKSNHKSLPTSSRVTLRGKVEEGGTCKNFRFLAGHQEKPSVGVLSHSPDVRERKPPGQLQHQPLPSAPHRRPRAGPAKLGSVCSQNCKKILVMTV